MKPAWPLSPRGASRLGPALLLPFVLSLATLALAPALAACRPPLVPAKPKVSLRMSGTPVDATVVIDDEAIGSLDLVAAHGVALPVGTHHITVKAGGYFPWDREVTAEEGQAPIVLKVALTPVPD